MGVVTIDAPALGGRFVKNGTRHHVIVTLHAQFIRWIGEKMAVGRTVRIVAGKAPVLFDNGMNRSLISRIVVALKTQSRPLLDEDQFFIITMVVVA